MSSIFICDENRIKELILKSLIGSESENGLCYSSFLKSLEKESQADVDIEIRNNRRDFAPSAKKQIDKILWQLINEQKLIVNFSMLQSGNVVFHTFS